MQERKWRYFVILGTSDGRLRRALSYRERENPNGDVDPGDHSWYRGLEKQYPQSDFDWRVIEMPAGTSPATHPRELLEALRHPLESDTWPSNDELP